MGEQNRLEAIYRLKGYQISNVSSSKSIGKFQDMKFSSTVLYSDRMVVQQNTVFALNDDNRCRASTDSCGAENQRLTASQ